MRVPSKSKIKRSNLQFSGRLSPAESWSEARHLKLHLPSSSKTGFTYLFASALFVNRRFFLNPNLAFRELKGYGGEGKPFGVGAGNAEIRARRIATFACTDPVEHMAGRPRQQLRRQHVSFHRAEGSNQTPSPRSRVAMMPLVPMKTAPLPVRMPG